MYFSDKANSKAKKNLPLEKVFSTDSRWLSTSDGSAKELTDGGFE